MTKNEKEIKACQDLLAHYQGKKNVGDCPFCSFVSSCFTCPWGRFEKMPCADYCKKLKLLYGAGYYRHNTHASKRWTKSRIKMLKRWIRLLKKESQ